jgi:hypothetical protein
VLGLLQSRGSSGSADAQVIGLTLDEPPIKNVPALLGPSAAAVTCQGSATVEGGDHEFLKEPAVRVEQVPCQIAKATSG